MTSLSPQTWWQFPDCPRASVDSEELMWERSLREWRHWRRRLDGSSHTVHVPRSTLLAPISTVRSLAFPWPISLYRSLWKAVWTPTILIVTTITSTFYHEYFYQPSRSFENPFNITLLIIKTLYCFNSNQTGFVYIFFFIRSLSRKPNGLYCEVKE